jgi:type IV secretory pathway VirJ component
MGGSQRRLRLAGASLVALSLAVPPAAAETSVTIRLRGQPQTLHVSGPPSGQPVVVSSGDGGWLHLAPQVAAFLESRGFLVVGFDSKAYLESFTTTSGTLRVEEEPADYRALIDYATQATGRAPILIGVSEGAALSVLAATDPKNQHLIRGVVALGLGDLNELAWRWKDSVIYLTHGVPREPTFSVVSIVGRMAPTPLALINSTRDEYVSAGEVDRIAAAAVEPKRLWRIDAADHRFSDKKAELHQRLVEAIDWIIRR